jgi:hypothetical protein
MEKVADVETGRALTHNVPDAPRSWRHDLKIAAGIVGRSALRLVPIVASAAEGPAPVRHQPTVKALLLTSLVLCAGVGAFQGAFMILYVFVGSGILHEFHGGPAFCGYFIAGLGLAGVT